MHISLAKKSVLIQSPEIVANDESIVLQAELPGLKKEDIDI
jgi:HSP20 family molecular chaperone IbpA